MPRRPFGYSGVSATHSRPAGIPVEVHRLGDQRLGGDELHREVGMNLEIRERVRRASAGRLRDTSALEISSGLQNSSRFVALSRPGDAAQQDRAIVRQLEGRVEMPGDADERAIRLRPAFRGLLINPHLRLDVVDVRLAAFGGFLALAAPSACSSSRARAPRARCPCRSKSRRRDGNSTRPW